MTGQTGHIELERVLDSIRVGHRHRTDMGDLEALAASIDRDGLLQPPTITPDGLLVCGARRLAAIRLLGWRTVNVWVRSGLSDRLGQLMAEQDDNNLHKPLTQREAAALYRELKQVLAEDAARRQAATRFSTHHQPGTDGAATVASPSAPQQGAVRRQAAQLVTGRNAYTSLERISELERLAADATQPVTVSERARAELNAIDAGGSITAAHQRVRTALVLADLDRVIADPTSSQAEREAAQREAATIRAASAEGAEDLHRLAAEAVARVKAAKATRRGVRITRSAAVQEAVPTRYPVRAFLLTWTELDAWWNHYDPAALAAALTDDQLEAFLSTVEGTRQFAAQLQASRSKAS